MNEKELNETAAAAADNNDDDHSAASGADDSHESGVSESSQATEAVTQKDGTTSTEEVAESTSALKISKLLVLIILACTACALGYLTYEYILNEEEEDFKVQFAEYGDELHTLIPLEFKNLVLSVENFAGTLTSFAEDSDSEWPFLTVPHFETRGTSSNDLSGALVLSFAPLVELSEREAWEKYSQEHQSWIQDSLAIRSSYSANGRKLKEETMYATTLSDEVPSISETIFALDSTGHIVAEKGPGPFLPVWQMAPAPVNPEIINFNLLSDPILAQMYQTVTSTGLAVLSEVMDMDFFYQEAQAQQLMIDDKINDSDNEDHPHSILMEPIHADYFQQQGTAEYDAEENPVVGVVIAAISWDRYFVNLLPKEAIGVIAVVKGCDAVFSYRLDGSTATFLGDADFHDPAYDDMELHTPLASFLNYNQTTTYHCDYEILLYPSRDLEEEFLTFLPIMHTVIVIMVFFLTTMVFVLYDFFVQQRQRKAEVAALRSQAIVSSLFPKQVREQMMREAAEQEKAEAANKRGGLKRLVAPKSQLKDYISDAQQQGELATSIGLGKPMADLFPSATVLFADIAGFTAWSSVREPCQVFILLETLYNDFDDIAARRRVFKVETIGDCYVATVGLPEPRKDHAVVMARFSRDILSRSNDLCKMLETTLGPDTGDLSLRVGMHSGPVTAGVLRGEKARFQLFGDTVNTASRIESTGVRNRIHVSSATAEQLKKFGKSSWLVEREDAVFAKGKGKMSTYWLELKLQSSPSSHSDSKSSNSGQDDSSSNNPMKFTGQQQLEKLHKEQLMGGASITSKLSGKTERLCKWNVDVLQRLLRQIISRRNEMERRHKYDSCEFTAEESSENTREGTVIDEVKEIIELPEYDVKVAKNQQDPESIVLDNKVTSQLFDYVALIALSYRDVPFHSFEHASHVTMSTTKLLSRIVVPDEVLATDEEDSHKMDQMLHDHTYGITSDPLTQFAVVFSALVHDVDHTGVPNAQLVKEGAELASVYNNQSVAEQNSIDMAWELLMDDSFKDLRSAIYSTPEEKKRFRQLLVNVVLATDIVDKELKELRNARWNKAFHGDSESSSALTMTRDGINRKATIVLEHIIQASDISHTMQHWHVYKKWNERFFEENMKAFKEGRMEKNPADFWYKGEIGFFDFYIIPLAKKLAECGVFGVSSDEYLNYAMKNRQEWEHKGEEVVAEFVAKYDK